MRWSSIAFFFGLVDLIQAQVVPGSYLGFPNCTDPCNYIVVNPASSCDIFAVGQTQASFITCLCKDTTLFASIVNCVVSVCTQQETETSFEIAAGACHNLGLTLATPSVSGYTLTASFPPPQTASSIPPTTPIAATIPSVTSAVTPAISHQSNTATTPTPNSNITAGLATTTSQANMTGTASSNVTVPAAYTGGAHIFVANKLLAGFGLSLYYALY